MRLTRLENTDLIRGIPHRRLLPNGETYNIDMDSFCFLLEIRNLKLVSRASDEITVSWTTCRNFTNQSIYYTPVGGELMYKTLDYAGKSNHVERIVNLVPCTQYKIDVKMSTRDVAHLQSLNASTLPGKGNLSHLFYCY